MQHLSKDAPNMSLKIQSQHRKKGVADHSKTIKRKQKIEHYGNIQTKYFATAFLIREQVSNGKTF